MSKERPNATDTASVLPMARLARLVLMFRGQKVMLDFDLASLYGVETKVLNQAVKRNVDRFPQDFMFRLSWEEAKQVLRSQTVTLDEQNSEKPSKMRQNPRSQIVTLDSGKNLKYRPYAFTEQGVAMLSSVLSSPRAVQVNIAIMRTFVQLRQMLASHADLARKLDAMEKKYDSQFRAVFDAIRELMKPMVEKKPRRQIGFHAIQLQHATKTKTTRARVSA
jgi:hypothetical protein